MLDALSVGHLTKDHPGNPHHVRVFLDSGENIGVIHSGESDRVLLKVAGGTPAMGNIVPETGFRKLTGGSLKARLLDSGGQFFKWAHGESTARVSSATSFSFFRQRGAHRATREIPV